MACEIDFVDSTNINWTATTNADGSISYSSTYTGAAVDSCFHDWPTFVPRTTVDDPTTADAYAVAGKITRVCVSNGDTGQQEYWAVMLDQNGLPQWQQVA